MKVAALAALCVLIALPAQAGQRQQQKNVSPSCDNDGRCTTFSVTASTSSHIRPSERKPHSSRCQWQRLDGDGANGLWLQHHGASVLRQQVSEVLRVAERAWLQGAGQHHQVLGTAPRMSRAPTTTSVPPAIFRRVGIAGPSLSTT